MYSVLKNRHHDVVLTCVNKKCTLMSLLNVPVLFFQLCEHYGSCKDNEGIRSYSGSYCSLLRNCTKVSHFYIPEIKVTFHFVSGLFEFQIRFIWPQLGLWLELLKYSYFIKWKIKCKHLILDQDDDHISWSKINFVTRGGITTVESIGSNKHIFFSSPESLFLKDKCGCLSALSNSD